MRIRKHAKNTSSVFDGAVLQGHVCQLNQSPWDVLTFPFEDDINQQTLLVPPPPPPAPPSSSAYQLDGYGSCAVNGTFYDTEQSIMSMKVEDNREMKKMNFFGNNVADVPANSNDFKNDEPDEEMVDGYNNVTTMCVKNDGKGWQCSREAKIGHNLCEHHFAQVKKHCSISSNSAQYSTAATTTAIAAANSDTKMKQTAAETGPSSRGRPHRPKKSSSSDYYYYSGFGPLWGKKRSPSTGKKNNAAAAAVAKINSSDSHRAQTTTSQMDNEGRKKVEEKAADAEVENCKLIKRARKPMKARSLKFLMY